MEMNAAAPWRRVVCVCSRADHWQTLPFTNVHRRSFQGVLPPPPKKKKLAPKTLDHGQYFFQNAVINNNWHMAGQILDIFVFHHLGISV